MNTTLTFQGVEVPECDWDFFKDEHKLFRLRQKLARVDESGDKKISTRTASDMDKEYLLEEYRNIWIPSVVEGMECSHLLLGARWALFFLRNQHLIPEECKQVVEAPGWLYKGIIFAGDTFTPEQEHNKKGLKNHIDGESVGLSRVEAFYSALIYELDRKEWALEILDCFDGQRHDGWRCTFAIAV
jgi:hypothetical protein